MAQTSLQGLPVPDFLNLDNKLIPKQRDRKKDKHEEAYDAFCKWAAMPEEVRTPSTQVAFEKKWGLPRNYTSKWKEKEDFQAKRLKYFWNWMFDKFPDVVYAVYRRATRNSSSDAKIFAELVGKKLETDQPKTAMLPMIVMGVPQDKIDRLFTPQTIIDAADKTVKTIKKEEAEIIPEAPKLEVEEA